MGVEPLFVPVACGAGDQNARCKQTNPDDKTAQEQDFVPEINHGKANTSHVFSVQRSVVARHNFHKYKILCKAANTIEMFGYIL